jgi:microcystin-dependent protein
MADVFIGEIKLVGFNFSPLGYAACQGQLISIQQNTALFSLLGTFYGGNGTSNFALPDLRGRAAVDMGSTYVIGQQAGAESVSLTANQYPAHSHAFNVAGAGTAGTPGGNYLASIDIPTPPGGSQIYTPASGATLQALNNTNMPPAIGFSGSGQAHQNMQPYLVLNYLIALQGIFPSRN